VFIGPDDGRRGDNLDKPGLNPRIANALSELTHEQIGNGFRAAAQTLAQPHIGSGAVYSGTADDVQSGLCSKLGHERGVAAKVNGSGVDKALHPMALYLLRETHTVSCINVGPSSPGETGPVTVLIEGFMWFCLSDQNASKFHP
jgi:hypothetical protein